jgi:hypothetical protein
VSSTLGAAPSTPPASRTRTAGWRDPRLWIGVAIVALSVVAGVRLLAAADRTVTVWSVPDDLAAGSTIDPAALQARRVRFVDEADLRRYLPTSATLPAELVLVRDVGAGELLPRAALGSPGGAATVRVPIKVAGEAVPPDVREGSRVDLYVSDEAAPRRPAALLLEDVLVTAAPTAAEQFGGAGDRQLVLGVPEDKAASLPRVIAAAAAGTVTVVGRG